jgi:hypothetical protein
MPYSGMNSPGNQIHITKGLTLQEREKKHGPNLVPALKLKSQNRGLYSRLPNCSYPHIDVSTSGERSGSSKEGGGGILAGGPRRNSNNIISNSMLPSIRNEKFHSGDRRHDHPFSPRNDGMSKHSRNDGVTKVNHNLSSLLPLSSTKLPNINRSKNSSVNVLHTTEGSTKDLHNSAIALQDQSSRQEKRTERALKLRKRPAHHIHNSDLMPVASDKVVVKERNPPRFRVEKNDLSKELSVHGTHSTPELENMLL